MAVWHLSMPLAAQDKSLRQAQDRPNVVIILADDLGIGDVSAFNENAAWKTPNIDRIAARGMSFTDAHTSAALCTPTRYGIMTGRYNWRSTLKSGGYNGYSTPLIEDERTTIAELFKGQGYHTALVGKWHLGWNWKLKGSRMETFDDRTVPVIDYSKPIKNGPEDQGFIYSFGTIASLSSPPFVWVENSVPTSIPKEVSVNYDEKAFWRRTLEDLEQKKGDFRRAVAMLEKSGALTATMERARDYGAKARTALDPFPDSEIKASLVEAVEFAIHRSY